MVIKETISEQSLVVASMTPANQEWMTEIWDLLEKGSFSDNPMQ